MSDRKGITRIRKSIGARLPDRAKGWFVRQYMDQYHRGRIKRADVVLISFAKSGRTWLRTMLGKALAVHYEIDVPDMKSVLMLDELAAQLPSLPVIVETHDGGAAGSNVGDLSQDKSIYMRKKVVFLARDPRDVVVSAYFQATKRERIFEGTIGEYLRQPQGILDTIIEHYNIWAGQTHIPRGFLLVRYEDLKADAVGQLRRILDFLELQEVSSVALQSAVEFTSFEKMRSREKDASKTDPMALRPGDFDDEDSYKTRRGVVGGYVDYLSLDDVNYMNERIDARLDPFFGYRDAAKLK